MKKISQVVICILCLSVLCSCNTTSSNYSDGEIQKMIDENCEFVVPTGFENADYSYGYAEEASEEAARANEDFSVSYTNEDKKIIYAVHLELCKDGQGKSYYKALAETPENGQIIEFDKKGTDSILKNMKVDNIRGEDDPTLFAYYILDGENVIRITVSSMEEKNVKDAEKMLDDFKEFLQTVKVK